MNITLDHPPKELSPNGRANRWAKAKATKQTRTLARLATQQKMRMYPEETYKAYSLDWYYKGCRPDDDNVLARCKAVKDGVCDALGIDDRTITCGGINLHHDKERAGLLTFNLYPF